MTDLHLTQGDLLGPFVKSPIDLRAIQGERFTIVLRADEPSTRIRYYLDSDGLLGKETQALDRRSNPEAYVTDRESDAVMVTARERGYDGPDPIVGDCANAIRKEQYARIAEKTKWQPLIEVHQSDEPSHLPILWMGLSWVCVPPTFYFLLVKKDPLLAAPFIGLTVVFKLLQMRSRR